LSFIFQINLHSSYPWRLIISRDHSNHLHFPLNHSIHLKAFISSCYRFAYSNLDHDRLANHQ